MNYFIHIIVIAFLLVIPVNAGFNDLPWEEDDQQQQQAEDPFNRWKMSFFDQWQTYYTFNFEVFYYEDTPEVREIIDNIEQTYQNIVNDLGYQFYFPVPKRIRVFVYPTSTEYHYKTSMSNWAGGHSDFKQAAIYTYQQRDLMQRVVVHELTHLIFDGYMGYPRNVNVTWLHEGLAAYEEKRYSKEPWDIRLLKKMEAENRLLPLRKTIKTHVGLEQNTDNIALWYAQLSSLVAFMLTLGNDGFVMFCHNLKRFKNIDEALEVTYPWNFKSVEDLDRAWREWLRKQKKFIYFQ